jgi:hypothetical protein
MRVHTGEEDWPMLSSWSLSRPIRFRYRTIE